MLERNLTITHTTDSYTLKPHYGTIWPGPSMHYMDNKNLIVTRHKTFTHGLEDHELIIQNATVIIVVNFIHGHVDH